MYMYMYAVRIVAGRLSKEQFCFVVKFRYKRSGRWTCPKSVECTCTHTNKACGQYLHVLDRQ